VARIRSILGVAVLLAVPIGCGDDDDSGSETGATVEIVILEEVSGGMFTATGDAVDEGLVCAAGDAQIIGFVDAETGEDVTDSTTALLVDQRFTCDDGSGTFTLQETEDMSDPTLIPRLIESGEPFPEQDWTVSSGTGAYESLQGSGAFSGQATEPGSETIRNTVTGVMSAG